jgi:tetratricopeptide (TPR) repeat protein
VPNDLDEAEAKAAGELYPQEKFERRIGDQLVAAPALERRYSLLLDEGRPYEAEATYRRATTLHDLRVAAEARRAIGVSLRRRRELDGARSELQRAITSRYPAAVGSAYFNLGRLLETSGDLLRHQVIKP